MREVDKKTFDAFLKAYPRKLETDVFMVMATWNDFGLGDWPVSIVDKIPNFEREEDESKYDFNIL